MMARILGRITRSRHASCRAAQGFTLVETLLALLIVALLTGMVAAGVPAAINAYKNIVDVSNAQLALSTTTSALRDELGLAVDVKTSSNGTAFYQVSNGRWVMIDNGGADSVGLVKHVYPDAAGSFNPNSPGTSTDADLIPSVAIAGVDNGDGLRVQMLGTGGGAPFITYENGVFTVKGIGAFIGDADQPAESVEEYKVKKVLEPES